MLRPRVSWDRAGRTELLVALALWPTIGLLAWLRLPPLTRGTVWAEDGMFLADRLREGVGRSALDPYAGYLHLAPRLVVDAAVSLVPLEHYAVTVAALCCAVVGLVGALVFVGSGSVVSNLALRVVLGVLTALLPIGPVEVLGNAANLHWYFLWLAPWLLLARPRTWWSSAALGAVALVAGLTEIQVAMFLPLVAVTFRDRRTWPVSGGLLVGAVAQVLVTVTTPRPRAPLDLLSATDLTKGYLYNVVLPLWDPRWRGWGDRVLEHGWGLGVLAAIPFALALVAAGVLTVRSSVDRQSRDLMPVAVLLALVVGALVPFVAGVLLNATDLLRYDHLNDKQLSRAAVLRYGAVPGLFLLAIAVVGADRYGTVARQNGARLRGATTVPIAVAVLVLALCASGFDVNLTRRTDGPSWSNGYADAERRCADAADGIVAVPTAPTRTDWHVDLPCAVVRRGSP